MWILPLALSLAAPTASGVPATPAPSAQGISWFQGPFFSARAKAKAENQPLLVLFHVENSKFCDQLFTETFSAPEVATALAGVVCFKADLTRDGNGHFKDRAIGKLADAVPVSVFPTLVYFGLDGKPDDLIRGFIPPASLVAEVGRMRAGDGTLSDLRAKVEESPKDIEAHWALMLKLDDFGYQKGYDEVRDKIRLLDPDERSRPVRQERLWMIQERLFRKYQETGEYDTELIEKFLEDEEHDSVAFEGWDALGDLLWTMRATLTDAKEKAEMGERARDFHRKAWPLCTQIERINTGIKVARGFWADRAELSKKEKAWILDVVNECVRLADEPKVAATITKQGRAIVLDTLACVRYLNGDRDSAIELATQAVEIDPQNSTIAANLAVMRSSG